MKLKYRSKIKYIYIYIYVYFRKCEVATLYTRAKNKFSFIGIKNDTPFWAGLSKLTDRASNEIAC